jgi:hypothetical protein
MLRKSPTSITLPPNMRCLRVKGAETRLDTHLDCAGWSGDALSTVNGNARLEWRPWKHLVLAAGYGFSHLVANGEILGKSVHLAYTLHGATVGFGIPF